MCDRRCAIEPLQLNIGCGEVGNEKKRLTCPAKNVYGSRFSLLWYGSGGYRKQGQGLDWVDLLKLWSW